MKFLKWKWIMMLVRNCINCCAYLYTLRSIENQPRLRWIENCYQGDDDDVNSLSSKSSWTCFIMWSPYLHRTTALLNNAWGRMMSRVNMFWCTWMPWKWKWQNSIVTTFLHRIASVHMCLMRRTVSCNIHLFSSKVATDDAHDAVGDLHQKEHTELIHSYLKWSKGLPRNESPTFLSYHHMVTHCHFHLHIINYYHNHQHNKCHQHPNIS